MAPYSLRLLRRVVGEQAPPRISPPGAVLSPCMPGLVQPVQRLEKNKWGNRLTRGPTRVAFEVGKFDTPALTISPASVYEEFSGPEFFSIIRGITNYKRVDQYTGLST